MVNSFPCSEYYLSRCTLWFSVIKTWFIKGSKLHLIFTSVTCNILLLLNFNNTETSCNWYNHNVHGVSVTTKNNIIQQHLHRKTTQRKKEVLSCTSGKVIKYPVVLENSWFIPLEWDLIRFHVVSFYIRIYFFMELLEIHKYGLVNMFIRVSSLFYTVLQNEFSIVPHKL